MNGRLVETKEDIALGTHAQLTIGQNNIVLERKSVRISLTGLNLPTAKESAPDPQEPPKQVTSPEPAQAPPPDQDPGPSIDLFKYTLQLMPNGFSDLLKKDEPNLLGVGVNVCWQEAEGQFFVVAEPGARASIRREVNGESVIEPVDEKAPLCHEDVVRVDYCQFLFRKEPVHQDNDETLSRVPKSCELIAGYRQTKLVGSGANGEVYEFKDHGGRSVAVKFLFPHLLIQDEAQKRFDHEAKVLVSLDHPGVLRVVDVGQAKDGRMYIMSEYLPDGTLKDLMKKGLVELDRAIQMGVDMCDALHYLHDRELVHRDVKPANIFLRKGRAVLADFGLVKGADLSTATRTGFTAGTPRYMSPEQFRGYTEDRSDQYSLGIVLYELLTGRKVFDAPEPIALAYMHVHTKPRSLRMLRPGLPQNVSEAVEKMIAKDPKDRFESMKLARQALMS